MHFKGFRNFGGFRNFEGLRGLFESWPVYRQLTGDDPLGRARPSNPGAA